MDRSVPPGSHESLAKSLRVSGDFSRLCYSVSPSSHWKRWLLKMSQVWEATLRSRGPLSVISSGQCRAIDLVFPSLFFPSSQTWDLISNKERGLHWILANEWQYRSQGILFLVSLLTTGTGWLRSGVHSYLWSWNSLKARLHLYLNQPEGPVHLEVYFCWFLIYCLLGNQGTLTSFGKLLLQGTNWVDFDLSFFNLQFLYVNLKP